MSIKALGSLQLPNQKEWAAGVGGLLAFGIITVTRYLGHPLGEETESLLVVALPPLVSKLIPPSAQDVLTHVNDAIVEAGVVAGKLTSPEQIVAADPSNTLVLRPAQLVNTSGIAAGQAAPGLVTQTLTTVFPAREAKDPPPPPPTTVYPTWGGKSPADTAPDAGPDSGHYQPPAG